MRGLEWGIIRGVYAYTYDFHTTTKLVYDHVFFSSNLLRKCNKNAYKTFLSFSPKAHDKSFNGLVKLWVLNIFIYLWLVVMVSVINLGGLEAHRSWYLQLVSDDKQNIYN